jgi:hypothetical protein
MFKITLLLAFITLFTGCVAYDRPYYRDRPVTKVYYNTVTPRYPARAYVYERPVYAPPRQEYREYHQDNYYGRRAPHFDNGRHNGRGKHKGHGNHHDD